MSMFEIMGDVANSLPVDYLSDKMFGIVDSAVDAAIGAGSAAIYGFLK